MRIVVLVKQVPEASRIAFDPAAGRLIREGVPLVLNTFDRRAVLGAIHLRERHGGDVIAMTMGPPAAESVLRECLALGADRGVLISDAAFAGSDTLATARTLARAIRREPFDLILCGQQSVDAETGQVGPQVAALLDIPHVAAARSIVVDGERRIVVEREVEAGTATIEASLPALVSVSEQLAKPVAPSADDLQAVASQPIDRLGIFELGGVLGEYGTAGSPTSVLGVRQLPSRRERSLRTASSPGGAAEALRDYLEWIPVRPAAGDTAPAPRLAGPAHWALLGPEDSADSRRTGEMLRAAGSLAGPVAGQVVAVALGHDPGDVGSYGADQVLIVAPDALPAYAPEPAAAALKAAIVERAPAVVLSSTGFTGREILPRTAALLGLGMTADCVGLSRGPDGQLLALKPAHGGRFVAPIAMRSSPPMVTIRPGVFIPYQHRHYTARVERLSFESLPPSRTRLIRERPEADPLTAAIARASCVIGVGAGIGDPANLGMVRELAQRLGAAIGGTRKVCDLGWLPRQAQIGLTGQSISPALYIALGVRGGFHHAVGLVRAGRVVAINNDPAAPIFEHADYGIVGDWAALVSALIAELDARPLRGLIGSLVPA